MSENLLIIFAKYPELGKVKSRLAHDIGDEKALDIYKELLRITESETRKLTNCDVVIYWADKKCFNHWKSEKKQIQNGSNLGERMKNAFVDSFNTGYKKVIIIGTDLPNISSKIINEGFNSLDTNSVVFGPASDGGYYLLGMNKMIGEIFVNKPWSQSNLLKLSTIELDELNVKYTLLEELNDIDTLKDLQNSSIGGLLDL